jgi:hypothetical protein
MVRRDERSSGDADGDVEGEEQLPRYEPRVPPPAYEEIAKPTAVVLPGGAGPADVPNTGDGRAMNWV